LLFCQRDVVANRAQTVIHENSLDLFVFDRARDSISDLSSRPSRLALSLELPTPSGLLLYSTFRE
jgi:hypothetical protein